MPAAGFPTNSIRDSLAFNTDHMNCMHIKFDITWYHVCQPTFTKTNSHSRQASNENVSNVILRQALGYLLTTKDLVQSHAKQGGDSNKTGSLGQVSSSSVGATTLCGFWPSLRFRFTIFYLYTSLSSFSLSSSLNPLLLGQAISILVFLLVFLVNMVPIQLIFWHFLLYPFWLRVLPNVIFVTL
jgi:hypothetical protein